MAANARHKAARIWAQKNPQPREDEAKVAPDGGEDGIDGVAGDFLEIAEAEADLSFHMADHGFVGGAAAQFVLDGAE